MTTALVAYLVASILGLWGAWLVASPTRLRGEPELSPPQIALLRRRGRRAALAAAVTELYAADLVAVTGRGTLRRGDAAVPGGLAGLPRAVHATLAVPRSLRSVAVRAPVRAALRAEIEELARLGAVPSRTRWRWYRLALLGVVVVALLGLSRAGALPPPLVLPAPVLVAAALAGWFVPRRTFAGARLLRRLRREQADRWETAGTGLVDSWTPQRAARVNALTGMVLEGLEPALRRGVRDRQFVEGRMDLGDGRSAYGPGGLGNPP